MIDLKPYGAFIENTVKPLLDRLEEIGIKLDKDNVIPILKVVGSIHFVTVVIQSITQVILMGLLCFILWTIYR